MNTYVWITAENDRLLPKLIELLIKDGLTIGSVGSKLSMQIAVDQPVLSCLNVSGLNPNLDKPLAFVYGKIYTHLNNIGFRWLSLMVYNNKDGHKWVVNSLPEFATYIKTQSLM